MHFEPTPPSSLLFHGPCGRQTFTSFPSITQSAHLIIVVQMTVCDKTVAETPSMRHTDAESKMIKGSFRGANGEEDSTVMFVVARELAIATRWRLRRFSLSIVNELIDYIARSMFMSFRISFVFPHLYFSLFQIIIGHTHLRIRIV